MQIRDRPLQRRRVLRFLKQANGGDSRLLLRSSLPRRFLLHTADRNHGYPDRAAYSARRSIPWGGPNVRFDGVS